VYKIVFLLLFNYYQSKNVHFPRIFFQDFPGPGILKKKIQDFPGGVGAQFATRSQAVARIADRTAKNCRGHVT